MTPLGGERKNWKYIYILMEEKQRCKEKSMLNETNNR